MGPYRKILRGMYTKTPSYTWTTMSEKLPFFQCQRGPILKLECLKSGFRYQWASCKSFSSMLQPALVSCRYLYWSLNGNVMKKKCPKKTSLSLEDFANFSAFLNILRRHLTLRFSGGQTFDLDQRIGYFWKDIIHIFHLTPISTLCDHWLGQK